MTPAIALDLTRLTIGPAWTTPRGIDRVDLAYAERFLQHWRGECVATLAMPWGSYFLDRARALGILRTVERLWGETRTVGEDPHYARACAYLNGEPVAEAERQPPRSRRSAITAAVWNVLKGAGVPLGASAARRVPEGAVYLNTGQIGIADARLLGWLNRRPDVRPVFMLHDTIPIDYPEHVPPTSRAYHHKMIVNAARYARGLIVTTRAAETDIRRELEKTGRSDIDIAAAPLPPSAAFLESAAGERLDTAPYFVICGAIEPRKNHLLLLNVWRELVRRDGEAAPRLVILGRRWNTGSEAVRMLERSPSLANHVVEIAGLSTPGLIQLLRGAQALLMPSFAEGFGLPIVEALSVGTPVIASNIAAHQEAGGPFATYLSPIDGIGWLHAIQDHMRNNVARRTALKRYVPETWDRYFDRIEPFVISLAETHTGQTPGVAAA
jgi:glycosyltransferase involved in cell wall biosynthesis